MVERSRSDGTLTRERDIHLISRIRPPNDYVAVYSYHSRLEVGEPLTVVRDPLAVLRAAENGDTQVIAVLTAYTPDAVCRIAAVMAASKIEECELF